LVVMSLVIGVGIGYGIRYYTELPSKYQLPEEIANISQEIVVVVRESPAKNRTLHLDLNQRYCKIAIHYGGNNPRSNDLAYPNDPIVFFFLEDLEDPEKADNYSDLIIRMNRVTEDGKLMMCIVFFAEGAYEKLVYYKNQLLHHYNDTDPTSNYGIVLLEIE